MLLLRLGRTAHLDPCTMEGNNNMIGSRSNLMSALIVAVEQNFIFLAI